MPLYHLQAADGGSPTCVDAFEAMDDEEALALAAIRLERREIELRRGDLLVARFSRDGRPTRMADRSHGGPPIASSVNSQASAA